VATGIIVGRPFTGIFWGLEAVHSALIALICFLIVLKTREAQQLSAHEGIRYFRRTFLFFGLASLLKLLIRHLALSFFVYPGLLAVADWVVALGVTGIIYAHTMAAFCLLYSIAWKDRGTQPWVLHLLALGVALIITFTNAAALYIAFQIFMIAYSAGVIHSLGKVKRGRSSQMLVIYELLLVFWMVNLLDTLIPVSPAWQVIMYLASFGIFVAILLKVWRRLGVKTT